MTEWIKQQVNSRLFRKLFFATLAATMIPMFIMILFGIQSGYMFAENNPIIILAQIVSIVLLALILTVIVSFYISRYVTTPISEFTKSATEIARGNFSHKVKINSNDEIGKLARLFNYMTTELRRLNEMNLANIIAERNKTQTIIRNIADGVIVTDHNARVLIVNSAAEHWFGLNQNHVLEKPISQVVNEPRLIQLVDEAIEKKKSVLPNIELSIKIKGEWKPRILQVIAARVLQEDNTLIGVVSILRDVTQQKEIDKMKTELVSMVAHELRSPLTSISGFSELLLDTDVNQEQSEEYAGIILKEANRLSDLINKFLDISRIESGRIQPKKSNVNLVEIVQMVIGNNSYLAGRKRIEVEVHTPDSVDKIWADSGMMEQVLINLFSNAVKYSPQKTRIDIIVKNLQDHISVEVHDQGFGIPKKSIPKIFDKFFRVTEDEQVRNVTGTGLGLALVKQIVDMHNGRMEVESKVGVGSVFTLIFPTITSRQQSELASEDSENIIH